MRGGSLALAASLLGAACGSSGQAPGSDGGLQGIDGGGHDAKADGRGRVDTGLSDARRIDGGAVDANEHDVARVGDTSVGPLDGSSIPDAPALPASLACTPPIALKDVSSPTTIVGQGNHVCTEAAVAAAVHKGGIITFDCGGPATIALTAALAPPTTTDTTIDGGGTVTLDGGGSTRILSFTGPGYRTTHTTITLQRLTMQHGRATGTALAPEPAPCSQGFDTDAGGGAVYVVDGVLHVLDSVFSGNAAATPGPDVGGGAIYVNGSLGAVIVGSRFAGNTGANGGAIGSLNSDLSIFGSTLESNTATGTGQNTTSSMCPSTSHEVGDGGSGGAVYLDGGSDGDTTFCGDVFSKNHANALGGGIFRVFDGAPHAFIISASTFDSNVADGPAGTTGAGSGGGAFYVHNADIKVSESTLSRNASLGCGAVQVDTSTLSFVNVTLAANAATNGVGGALCSFSGGTLTNCTFAGNTAAGGTSFSNYYAAAIFGSPVTLKNTLLANNTTNNSEGRMTCGATEMGSLDLQWPVDKVVGGSPDSPCVAGIAFADPVLGALQNNGGPTETQKPAAAGSVVQIGAACPAIDQTGKTRAAPCTLGALEL